MLEKQMRGFIYVITRDHGFAPNPFGKFCTLATCKPDIRKRAVIGDWVIGIGSRQNSIQRGKVIHLMEVTEKITFAEYWKDPRFAYKKPIVNGSRKVFWGDNIYHRDANTNDWVQADSHHSLEDGSVNTTNLLTDTGGVYVLISANYLYFGAEAIIVPNPWNDSLFPERSFRNIKNLDEANVRGLVGWISNKYSVGYHGTPLKFRNLNRFPGNP